MATVPTAGTTFEILATAALAVASISGAAAFSGTAALSGVSTMAVAKVAIFPAIGPVSIAGTAKLAIGTVNVTHPGSTLIGGAISDILGVFGCCGSPNDCVLSEAVKAVNAGLQQFYLSDRANGVATNIQRQAYANNGVLTTPIYDAGARLPDINVSSSAQAYGVTNTYSVQNVVQVVYESPAGHAITLRSVKGEPGSISTTSGQMATSESWFEDISDPNAVPLFYIVYNYLGIPMIKAFPAAAAAEGSNIWVHYVPKAKPVTADDLTNGRAFDVQAVYVESWIMPLCRYAALSSGYFDAANAPLAASIRERYAETLKTLGLADLQQPNT